MTASLLFLYVSILVRANNPEGVKFSIYRLWVSARAVACNAVAMMNATALAATVAVPATIGASAPRLRVATASPFRN
jgi:hypothetical protein